MYLTTLTQGPSQLMLSTCLGNATCFMHSLHFVLFLECYRKVNRRDQQASLWCTHLKVYLTLTSTLGGGSQCDQLLITNYTPHKAASTQPIGPWLRDVMTKSGIDIQLFSAHSTRAASARLPPLVRMFQ